MANGMNTDGDMLVQALERMHGSRVLIVGDIMLDHYLVGKVERISPEAPVPVVQVREERHLLGGAGNVARNIRALGGRASIIALRGQDADGDLLERLLADEGVESTLITAPDRPTTKKTRIIAHNQQVVRVDRERPTPVAGHLLDQVLEAVRQQARETRVIVLSDYGKGLVGPEFMERFMALVGGMEPRPLVYVDPKVRNFPLYKGVDLLTPNTKEASQGSGVRVEQLVDVLRAGLAVFKVLKNEHLLITLGPDGMALFEQPGQVWHIPTAARKVFDVTGAGDTVIATVALASAAGMDLLTACKLANCAAGLVVAEVGAAVPERDRLRQALADYTGEDITAMLAEDDFRR